MSCGAGQTAVFRPAAIAVHDDADGRKTAVCPAPQDIRRVRRCSRILLKMCIRDSVDAVMDGDIDEFIFAYLKAASRGELQDA